MIKAADEQNIKGISPNPRLADIRKYNATIKYNKIYNIRIFFTISILLISLI